MEKRNKSQMKKRIKVQLKFWKKQIGEMKRKIDHDVKSRSKTWEEIHDVTAIFEVQLEKGQQNTNKK